MRAITKNRFARGIIVQHNAFLIDRNQAINRIIQNRLQAPARFFFSMVNRL